MKFRVLFHHRIVALTQCRGVMLAELSIGLVTLIISSIIAIVVLDVKKIIALSTLRQVGFMFLRIGFRWLSMSYFHLLSHAFYKSCIFIHVGITLLTRFHQQDKRNQSNAIAGLITTFGLILTLISLSGLIFSSGLVSKESVINISTTAYFGRVILIVVFIRIVLTCYYSTRIIISMNSIYNRLNTLIIVGTCSSGLLTLRLVFRWIITSNLLVLPTFHLSVELIFLIVSFLILFWVIFYIKEALNTIIWWNKTIGTIDLMLILIQRMLYSNTWRWSNITIELDKNILLYYNLEYWLVTTILGSIIYMIIFNSTIAIWITLSLVLVTGLLVFLIFYMVLFMQYWG